MASPCDPKKLEGLLPKSHESPQISLLGDFGDFWILHDISGPPGMTQIPENNSRGCSPGGLNPPPAHNLEGSSAGGGFMGDL